MRHGWLTTLRRDGSARTTRVRFVEESGSIWIATSTPARKVADLGQDPRVTFAIEGRDGSVRGTAEVVPIEEHPEIVRAFAEQYDGWDAADPGSWGPRVLIRIAPGA